MTSDDQNRPEDTPDENDQDAEPASTPTGAAAAATDEEDQDAEPASAPEPS